MKRVKGSWACAGKDLYNSQKKCPITQWWTWWCGTKHREQIRGRKMHVYQADTHPPWSENIVLLLCSSSLDSSCWTVQPPLWLGCHSFWQSSGCDLWRWDRKWNWSKFQTTARCTWGAHPLRHVDTHSPPTSGTGVMQRTRNYMLDPACGVMLHRIFRTVMRKLWSR